MRLFTTSSQRASTTSIPAISLEAISVRYWLYQGRRPLLQDYLSSIIARRPLRRDVWALRDVSLTVQRGEVLGLAGSNGSGKSTLLKVIARILRPTTGRVVVHGRTVPLIELGAGFQPDLTGRENVLLKSAILGYDPRDIRKRIGRIVDFAGLHEFIDAPLHTYSSGMVARLAFAVATDVRPDILIIDEVLAVGDAEFRERSEQRVAELRRTGTTILLVSHNSATLRQSCDRVGWLAYGRLQMLGDAAEVLQAYEGGLSVENGAIGADGLPTTKQRGAVSAIDLQVDDKLFVLRVPGADDTSFQTAIERHFDPEHISPFHSRAALPPGARMVLAPYRLISGTFFYDQMTRLLSQSPICATLLPPPAQVSLAPDDEQLAENGSPQPVEFTNPLTCLLGRVLTPGGPVPHNSAYLAQPVGRDDFRRALAVLESLAFVGLAARPLESLLLLWYTFGWMPDQSLALAQMPHNGASAATEPQAQPSHEYDRELYEHACRLFDQRLGRMTQDLCDRFMHLYANELVPPLPLEVQIGLLRQHHERRRAERGEPLGLRFTFDRPVPGTGWYGVEYNPQHGTFRWTGPDRQSTLQLPLEPALAARSLWLRCRILLASRPSALKSLRFFVNDQPVFVSQTRVWDGSILCEGPIPTTALHGRSFATIRLEVDRTVIPAANELAYEESRHLGVALSWMELVPSDIYSPAPTAVEVGRL